MYDYKFRQSEFSFSKPKRSFPKVLVRVVGLVLAAGAVYGVVQLGLNWKGGKKSGETDSNIIPLELPARHQPDESAQPQSHQSIQPAETSPGQGIAKGPTTPQREIWERISHRQSDLEGIPKGGDNGDPRAGNEDGTWIEHEVEPGESLASIFQDNDLSPQLLQRILRSGKEAKRLETIRPRDKLRIHLDPERQFAELHLQIDGLRSVKYAATDSGIKSSKVRKPTRTKATAASSVIDHTLFSSAAGVGVPDAITAQLAKIFGWDIDFALEIRPGDRFTVIYEELWAEGRRVGSGQIIAAEFINQGHSHRAIRFKDSQGKTDYYSPDGAALKKTFFRTPVNFTRISSGFSTRRWHPVLRRWRAHKGVDYAAPAGTPIIATGDGTVEYCGRKRGYGRVVYLSHGRNYRTVYGHMSGFAKGLSKGDRVKQGEVIGFVGQSGLATGPHLHYEFHINGVHRNPLTVKAPIADPLSPGDMKRFREIAAPLLASLEQTAGDTMLAAAR